MSVTTVSNPIMEHALTTLRDENSSTQAFRVACKQVVPGLILEASKRFSTKIVSIETPVRKCQSKIIEDPIVVVPILRAGLAMLNDTVDLIPNVKIGYFGIQRNEATAEAQPYYQKLPNIKGANVIVVDPMLATGNTSVYTLKHILEYDPKTVTLVCIVSAPEGIKHVHSKFEKVDIVTAAIDECLNDKNYIVPGLGDYGDRFNGTV
jgi:uracil phosphoribosyltransferase